MFTDGRFAAKSKFDLEEFQEEQFFGYIFEDRERQEKRNFQSL